MVFRAGEPAYDLIVVETGTIELVAPPGPEDDEVVIATYGRGGFIGELNLLTGQTVHLAARVVEPGRIYRIPPPQFRRLMADEADLSDLLLRAFLARRDRLRAGVVAASNHGCQRFRGRTRPAHLCRTSAPTARWIKAGSPRSPDSELDQGSPRLICPRRRPRRVLRRATPAELAATLGLSYRAAEGGPVDLIVVGAGPAGLAAASTPSEGLDTVVLDGVGTGGQAAASSRIESPLGFPRG